VYAPSPRARHEHAPSRLPAARTRVRASIVPDVALVVLSGEYDLSRLDELEASLVAASSCTNVVVDLIACAFIDVTTISALVAAQVAAAGRGGQVALLLPPWNSAVTRLTRLTGLTEIMPSFATLAHAIAHLQPAHAVDGAGCAGAM
jgi:anti-anti-sigma factor